MQRSSAVLNRHWKG